jgi:hypothetical protein
MSQGPDPDSTLFSAAEVLPANLESPLYTAVRECEPDLSVEVTTVTVPFWSVGSRFDRLAMGGRSSANLPAARLTALTIQ